ncbi:MAG: hypothetical protein FD124_861 [Alphaproteobacteria bacterium]|nr:MAG: hypothetical protein FD160_2888 [Caulobacteraceae bacterium]TPW07831.1 MAG: hypothetical protein FD124_861 [Alphaproteobacteria bacterium]
MIGISRADTNGRSRRKRRSAERFARGRSRVEIVVFVLILAGLGMVLLSGANHEAYHKILVVKPLKRAITN